MKSSLSRRLQKILRTPFLAGLALGIVGTATGAGMLGSAIFPDVPRGSYYDNAIGEMYANEIIKGYDSGKFGPDDAVTRGQLAVMLQRFKDKLDSGEWEYITDTGDGAASSRAPRSSRGSSSSSSIVSSVAQSSSSLGYNPKGILRFSTTNFVANPSKAVISVVRTGGNEGSTSIRYTTADGTAVAGTDYRVASGTLLFANKETSKTFSIDILGGLPTSNKLFSVKLDTPGNGAFLGNPSTSTVTIQGLNSLNSSSSNGAQAAASSSVPAQGALTLAATQYSIRENGQPLTITVNRIGGSQSSVTVSYATANGSATAGTDYASTAGTLTFNGGETSKTFTISPQDNSFIAGSKNFTINLSSPGGGAVLGETKSASITIMDDESQSYGSGSLKFSKSNYEVQQSQGFAIITVQRTGGASGQVSVPYQATVGTAVAGLDFVPTTGTLVFAAGEAAKTFSVALYKNSEGESGRTVNLTLNTPTGGLLGDPATALITIYR